MCGIAGIYRFAGEGRDGSCVEAMLEPLIPRGPDDEGLDTHGPVTLGNRRLAVLDLTAAGRQPMRSRNGRWILTFNGEIYNFQELKRELGLRPEDVSSGTDTEVLLNAWDRWGIGALPRFVGQWAFAIYDVVEGELWITRDRFGEKPLYYHRDAEALTFASSIRAVLASGRVTRELDPGALKEYLSLRYVLAPRTIVAGVHKLPAGHYIHVKGTRGELKAWYDPRFEACRAEGPRSDLVDQFDSLLRQATRRCCVSDVPVALLLSDGIDSNGIRSVLDDEHERIRSFTFVPSEGGATHVEGDPAHQPAAAGKITRVTLTIRERLDAMIPAFGSLTEPVGDGASLATWALIRRARQEATVFLCGHGGDEVLGGYRLSQDRFRLAVLRRLAWLPGSVVRSTLDRYLFGSGTLDERVERLRTSSPPGVPAAARYLIHRPLPEADVDALLGNVAGDGEPYLTGIDRLYSATPAATHDLDRMQEVMLRTFLSENILSFADGVAMDSSAELRMPYLDRDLVDFVFSLPPSARVGRWPARSNTKQILRWWGREHLPRAVTRGRKRAFNFGNLPPLLRDFGDEVRGLALEAGAVRRALPGLASWLNRPPETVRGPWEGTLWALLALGVWCEAVGIRA